MQDDYRVTQPPDHESRAAGGTCIRSVDRERQSAVELRRVDRNVRGRLRQRGDQRRRGWTLPADLLQRRPRAAVRLRLRSDRRWQDDDSWRLWRLLELHARRHVVVEGAEPALPAVARRSTPTRPRTAATCCSRTACHSLPASIRTVRRRQPRARSSTSTSATPTRGSGTSTSSARSSRTTCWKWPTSDRRAGRCCSRATRTRRRRSSG